MVANRVMLPGLFLLFFFVTGSSASRSILISDKAGIHIINKTSGETKPVLMHSLGVHSVQFDLDSGYIYGIVGSVQATAYKIIRTKVLDSSMNHTCQRSDLKIWCSRDKNCKETCSSSNPYNPEEVLVPSHCKNASNLALDWINKNVYWTCDPKSNSQQAVSTLYMATSKGSNNRTILSRTNRIKAVVIDPLEENLFVLESVSNTLTKTTLEGKEDATFKYQFNDEILDISLDTKNKLIYVVGKTKKTAENETTYIASLDYGGEVFKKLFLIDDTGSNFKQVVVSNGIIFWLTQSNTSQLYYAGDSDIDEKLKTKKIYIQLEVRKWSLVDTYVQRPINGSVCSNHGCPSSCTLTKWMQITCTNENEVESFDFVNSKPSSSTNVTVDPRKATSTGTVMTSSSNVTVFFTVVFCIWFSICVVVLVAKRRAKQVKKRNYKPSGTQSSTFSF